MARGKAVQTEEPEVADVQPVIIRKMQVGSSRLILTPTITNEVTKETVPGIDISFETEAKGMWHSDYYNPPPSVLRYYGSKEKVVEAIKTAMDATMALDTGSYEYLTQEQYVALAAQEQRKDLLATALAEATANPESADAQALLEAAKKLAAKKSIVKRGAITAE